LVNRHVGRFGGHADALAQLGCPGHQFIEHTRFAAQQEIEDL
jgi:hypothetical protein